MSYPAVIDSPGTAIQGTTPIDTGSFQHASQHDILSSGVIGIETTLGTNSGTAVLGAFTTNDKAVRHQGGVFQIAHQGTFNNSVVGTPAITGGTANSQVIGTPAITGGTANNQVLGTPALTGGTATSQTISTPTIRNWNGWEDANETWTFASATTITVPSGAASKYQKGDKIKLTQTTVKYFFIVGVADTVLTITGGTDYTLANAAISANFYSHDVSPIGFPDWFNYTPTLSCSGSMTIGSVSVTESKFTLIGTTCFYELSAKGTTAGSTAGNIITTVPINRVSAVAFVNANMVGIYDGGGLLAGVSVWNNTAQNSILTARYDEVNFGIGGGRGIDGTFIYQI